LDQDDPAQSSRTPEERAAQALALEDALRERLDSRAISASTYTADGRSTSVRVTSDGFVDAHTSAGFSVGAELTIDEGNGRRPEGHAGYGTRHLGDLPPLTEVAAEAVERAAERIGAAPVESGRYPVVVLNRTAGRILGLLSAPLSGSSLYERRSCLERRRGTRIGSPLLTLKDDPLLPRGLGSRPWDGDGLVARPIDIVYEGILQEYYLSVYHARKLAMAPTTGGRSNWVVPAGDRPWQAQVSGFPRVILVHGFLGGNANPITGDFSFGIRGSLVEHGQITAPIAEMNVSGNLLDLFERLVGLGDDVWRWSSTFSPSLIFDAVDVSGT
jgi:PmbA protein